MNTLQNLQRSLQFHFLRQELGVAGQVVYYDSQSNTMVLGIHTTSPEKAQEVAETSWESLPEKLKNQLVEANVGFAVRML